MKFIDSKTHAILDYTVGILLIFTPWIFGFYQGGIETWIAIFIGAGSVTYSLFTNYEWSMSRNVSLRSHLRLDFLCGTILALSPWMFGFAYMVFWPHLIIGLFLMGSASFTRKEELVVNHSTI